MTIDVFLVGGGGGGNNGGIANATGGGGSGYTTTAKNVQITANTEYNIVVGAGGTASNDGGTSTAFEATAKGGYAATGSANNAKGGNGGSGGGVGAGEGGIDGANAAGKGGTGQGTTTREFRESTGDLYATGGGGSDSSTAEKNGAPNTGDGGSGSRTVNAGEGGSGIVVIRKHKGSTVTTTASLTEQSGVSYTNGLDGLSADEISLFSAAISNNSYITNDTSVVYLDNGDIHRKVSIGDQVTLSLNGTNYYFDIIGFNHDTLTDTAAYDEETATGKAGITFQIHDCFATTYKMNSSNTNRGGWKNSSMRTSTMATMKGYLPDDWEAIIKPVNKTSSTGGGSSSGTETVSDSCFLLSEIEIFGSRTNSVSGEGTQYAYYKAGNSAIKNISGTAHLWWERSSKSNNSGQFCRVSTNGKADYYNAGSDIGVAFSFCV